MIAHVYKPKRFKNGKLVVQRTYRGRFRLAGETSITDVPLDTADKQAAQSKLMALIHEKERIKAGLAPAKAECDAASKSVLTHLEDFVADLKALGRSAQYQRIMKGRLTKLFKECSFNKIAEITPDRFTLWRIQQKHLTGKTLNEYLNFANAFLNWMKRQGRLAKSPLESVTKIDLRGRQKRRRAFTQDELSRLLDVAGPRRLLYLAAVYTGLRVDELRKLLWADLHLEAQRPFLLGRASTTKNRKEAIQPLHPALAEELRRLPRCEGDGAKPVFIIGIHPERNFKRDLAKARIDRFDALGRKADFHGLRYTFATRLANNGISQRLAQELMRHSDPALTANIYTDATQLPTYDAVASLPWEGEKSGADEKASSQSSQIASQSVVSERHALAQPDNEKSKPEVEDTAGNIGQSHLLAPSVT